MSMNIRDILRSGHETVLEAVDSVPAGGWTCPGLCGAWSAKEILAHLASFERLLVEVLASFLGDDATPTLERFCQDPEQFNRQEVDRRKERTVGDILAEYEQSHAQAGRLLARIPQEMRWQNGTLPWYGDGYDLEDFLVYTIYGHKREHCAQMALATEFRDPSVV